MTETPARSGTPAPTGLRMWIAGARPRTLPAALIPVAVGTAIGKWESTSGVIWWRAACALIVSLAIQTGTNYANDYSDGVRGTDESRVGPMRLVSGGLAAPATVKKAAFLSFLVAGVAGLALAAATTWWVLLVGAGCFAAGWLYTGGPIPYGYLGLGEVFVFAFFGVVATMGSSYVQNSHLYIVSFVASLPVGLLATALLESNNLRDIAGDAASSKRTLAVRVGQRRARWLYVVPLAMTAMGIGLLAHWRPYALIALVALPFAVRPIRLVMSGAENRSLLPVLAATGRLQISVGLLLTVGILV